VTSERTLQIFRSPHLLNQSLNDYFIGNRGDDLSLILSAFPTNCRFYIMGGLLRNLMIEEIRGLRVRSADVDLVVDGVVSKDELVARVRGYCIRENDFGGAKCQVRPEGIVFDVWRIEDHVTMSSTPRPHTVDQLLKHNLLDVDAILLDLQTYDLYDYGCQAAIQRGSISLLGKEGISNDFAAAQAAHIILTTFKTGFELSREALHLVRQICESANAKRDVIRTINKKMPDAGMQIEEFLQVLLKEELWPIMVP
jgi:hypothetical protein